MSAAPRRRLPTVAEPYSRSTAATVAPRTTFASALAVRAGAKRGIEGSSERFVKSRCVGPILGLVPRKHQSGEVNRHGRITKRGDEMTRTMLYEATNTLLARGRFCSLKAWGLKIRQYRGYKRAKVAVARKLAVVMHAMWVHGTEFRWGAAEAA